MNIQMILLIAAAGFTFNAVALNPSRDYESTPDKHNITYKEMKVNTKDGARLNVWYFPNSKTTKNSLVISCSGDGNMADNIELISHFISAGYNVITYDYRGYGKSSDFTIDPEMYIYSEFITDLNTVCDTLRFLAKTTKFDFYGINIGAGLSLAVASHRMESKRVIVDSPWLDLQKMKDKIKKVTGEEVTLPIGYDKNYEPVYCLQKTKTKIRVLVIVSAKDKLFGPDDVKEMKKYKGIEDTLEIQTIKSASKEENFTLDKDAYFKIIVEYLKKPI